MSRIVRYEEGLDEVLMLQNPKGGRPMSLGKHDLKGALDIDISAIREESELRYHLGYCACSRAIKVGHRRAEVLAEALHRQGVRPIKHVIPWRVKLAKLILPKSPLVDIFTRTA